MTQFLVETSIAALSEQAWRLVDASDAVVADLDGCLVADNQPLPGVTEFVARLRQRLVIASNNSTHSATQLARLLARNGLEVSPSRLVLAGEVAVRTVADRWPGARLMLLGTEAIADVARQSGLLVVDQQPEVVLLTRALSAGTTQLEAAIGALHAGAVLVVANPDLSHPGPRGVPRVETGALWALLRSVLPGIDGMVVGKPEQALFQAALAIDSTDPGRAVMIGDNASTDIEGARRIGMNAIHLRSSVSSTNMPRAVAMGAH
jgi:HAD superfamily hydrolase (TIGR01450 family)